MSTVNPRITEIKDTLSAMVEKKVQASLGTDQERVVMNACMDSTLTMAREMRELVIAGLTYEIWLDWYINKSLDSTYALSFINGDEEMLALIKELKAIDLTEHYVQNIVSVQTIENLDGIIEHMVHCAAQMREIWAEEDEVGLVEVRDPNAPAFDPDLELHFDSTLVEKD